jgi:pilus assembly protein CpaC
MLSAVIVLLGHCCLAGAALAQSAPARLAPPGLPAMLGGDLAAAAADESEKPVHPQNVTLDVGRGTMLRLPEAAASVLAADPTVARVQPASPTRLFLIGVAAGHTTVLATNAAGGTISQFDVTVTNKGLPPDPHAAKLADPSGALSAIALSVPGARNIKVRAIGKDLEVVGIAPNPAAANEIESIVKAYVGGETGEVINNLIVLGSIQVNVRVRFAEIQRTITRELGFNWQSLSTSKSGFQFGLLTGGATTAANFALNALGINAPNGVRTNQVGFGSTRWDINGVIDALASDQLITILAEPNLTALSGETASFLAGGEFPVPVAGSNTGEITISFKQFGISLSVVPTVLAPDRLNLRVRPEVSELSDNGAISVPLATGTVKIPALTVRRAETTIELGSGQSFAIAGLLQKTSTQSMDGVPGLGEMPVLGALFRSSAFQRQETELVIIVTPYLVKPAATPIRLRAPTDGFKPATDLDRILFGRQVAGGRTAASTAIDAGFILR